MEVASLVPQNGGVLGHASPSQISEFRQCKRKWVLNKVFKVPQPKRAFLDVGTEAHSQMEAYQERGVVPSWEPAKMLTMDPRVPQPKTPGGLIEHPRNYGMNITLAGVPVRARMDMILTLVDPLEIWDWKTTKDFAYAKTPEELQSDVQLNIYAKWGFHNFPSAKTAVLSHGYMRTQGASACRVVQTDPLPKAHVDLVVAGAEATVEEMKVLAAVTNYADAPPTWTACGAYGGCPYREICATKETALSVLFGGPSPQPSEKTVSLKDKILSKTAINPPDAAPPVRSTPPEPATEPPAKTSTPVDRRHLALYIDCLPTRGVALTGALEDAIARRAAPIASAAGVRDVREIEFAKGTHALLASFQQDPLDGVYTATSVGLSAQVLEVLLPHADFVVRGIR